MTDYNPNQGYNQPQGVQNPYGATTPVDPNASDKRTFGMWSLWLGIGGIVLAFGLPSVAAVIFGIVALVKEPRSKTLGIWGIVLGALGIIWSIVLIFVIIPIFVALAIGAAFVSEYGTYTTYSY